jgi:hypothetical protein
MKFLLEGNSGVAIALILCFIAIYFIPSILGRNKKNFAAIFILNLLLGWTILGWVGALVWAVAYEKPDNHL